MFLFFRKEVDELQQRLREVQESHSGAIKANDNALTVVRQFRVNDRFEMNRDDATYNLALESEIPIEHVLLQCDVILDILDVEKNSAVMSFSDCDPKVINKLFHVHEICIVNFRFRTIMQF